MIQRQNEQGDFKSKGAWDVELLQCAQPRVGGEMVVVKMWWGCNKWGWPNMSFLLFHNSWQNSEPFFSASIVSCSSVSVPSLDMEASSIYGHLYHHRFTVNIPKRITYSHSLYLLTSHHSSSDWILLPIMHLTPHSLEPPTPPSALTANHTDTFQNCFCLTPLTTNSL